MHLFPGFSGLLVGLVLFFGIVADGLLGHTRRLVHVRSAESTRSFRATPCHLCPGRGVHIVGIATGSIVLLVGSSGLHSSGRLPWLYASPLVLLALCVIYGVLLMVLLAFNYEMFLHGNVYTRFQYARNQAFGFSALKASPGWKA